MPADMLTDDYARAGGLRDDQRPTAAAATAVVRMQGTEMCARLGLLGEEDADHQQQQQQQQRDGHIVIGSVRQVDCRTTPGGCPSNPSTFALLTAAMSATGEEGCGGGKVAVGDAGQGDCLLVRKSANMTECVAVPSSEHVAEIVGRQGCKIKALRAKTNTYIKTPVRGDEPVFVVTGRREDVASAKREILSAAEHFSQIRASRRSLANRPTNNVSTAGASSGGSAGAAGTVGQVTQEVRVPFRVVGLVVGPKGATVKRIQQETQTYIVTPSRDKDPVFEIIGTPENVERAKREIESYISLRTKGELTSGGGGLNNSWTNLNHHQHHHHQPSQQPESPPLDERQSSKTTADLLGLLLQNPAIDGNNSIFTSYNNILNLGLGQLRLSKTNSTRIANAVSSSEFAVAGRPFSLDAADLFDGGRMLSTGELHQHQLPLSAKWRSYESDDILCAASSSSSSSSSSSEQQQQQQQLMQGRNPIVNPDNRWQEASHGLLAPIFGHQGADPVGRDGAWGVRCDDHSQANMHVHEAILGMCVGSLYAGSLFNSSCPDVTLVPGNANVVHLSSGSVSDSSSTSPTDFGLLISNQDFDKKPCAMSDANKVESSTRCPTCY